MYFIIGREGLKRLFTPKDMPWNSGIIEEAWIIPQMFIQPLLLKSVVTYYMYTEISYTKY